MKSQRRWQASANWRKKKREGNRVWQQGEEKLKLIKLNLIKNGNRWEIDARKEFVSTNDSMAIAQPFDFDSCNSVAQIRCTELRRILYGDWRLATLETLRKIFFRLTITDTAYLTWFRWELYACFVCANRTSLYLQQNYLRVWRSIYSIPS